MKTYQKTFVNAACVVPLISVAIAITGCASAPAPQQTQVYTAPPTIVKYADSQGIETVTADFGSTDLQTITETMVR